LNQALSIGSESGVALRLPPQSKATLSLALWGALSIQRGKAAREPARWG
jgi:hypothetical protein